MRILQVVHDFLPKYNAGTERYTYDLCRELMERTEVSILCGEHDPSKKKFYADERYDGLPVRRIYLPGRHEYRQTYLNPGMNPTFRNLLDEFSPDVIHIQHLIYLSLSFVDIARKRGIPVIMTLHDYWLMCPLGQLLKRDWGSGTAFKRNIERCMGPENDNCLKCMCPPLGYILSKRIKRKMRDPEDQIPGIGRILRVISSRKRDDVRKMFGPVKARLQGAAYLHKGDIEKREQEIKRIIEKIHLFISPSEFLRDRFIDWDVPEEKIIHIENGTEVRPFNKFQKGKRVGSGKCDKKKIQFGFVGTVKPHKAPHLLLKALGEMKDPSKVTVTIYGDMGVDPVYSQYLRKLSKNLNVEFKGSFDEDEKPAIYNDMDALVVPSVWFENSPVTIHEAFAAGIPVITSDIGGMKELVEPGKNGLLFRAGSVPHLTRKLDEFTQKNKLRERLIKGIKNVKTIEEHGNELLTIYQRAMDDLN